MTRAFAAPAWRSFAQFGSVCCESRGWPDAVPGRKGVAARALCLGFLVVGMVVGEMAREDDVEVGWENRARCGGGLSGMRTGRYGLGNVSDGSGWRVVSCGGIVVGVEVSE